jgi:hypothetical protein
MLKKLFSATALSLVAVLVMGTFQSTLATGTSYPEFPHCPNPGGTLVVGYEDGWHEIPGIGLKEGSDYVYKIGEGKYVQCFCPHDQQAKGIQSNWIHESQLSAEDFQALQNQGWMLIEDGSSWGLPGGKYLVQNREFECHAQPFQPEFPNCPNPGGTLLVGYEHGQHQIPGGDLREGSDYVYKIEDGKFVQCFCPLHGTDGIQSNWLHESKVPAEHVQSLLDQGWFVIEDGAAWGLPAGKYFVKNHHFDCEVKDHEPDKDKDRGKHKEREKHLTKHKKFEPRGKALGHQKNKFHYVYEHKVMVKQSNQANIHNQVNVVANTGNNTIKGSTQGDNLIVSGDVVQMVDIKNMVNQNIAHLVNHHPALQAGLAR